MLMIQLVRVRFWVGAIRKKMLKCCRGAVVKSPDKHNRVCCVKSCCVVWPRLLEDATFTSLVSAAEGSVSSGLSKVELQEAAFCFCAPTAAQTTGVKMEKKF